MDDKLMNQIELLDEHIHLLAKGEEGSKSDLDLAVLFSPYSPDKHNLQLLVRLEQDISRTLPFSKVDLVLLQKERITFKFEVIKTGKVIYCLDEDERTDFENIVVRDYLDFAPFLNRYWQEMAESIRGGKFLAQ